MRDFSGVKCTRINEFSFSIWCIHGLNIFSPQLTYIRIFYPSISDVTWRHFSNRHPYFPGIWHDVIKQLPLLRHWVLQKRVVLVMYGETMAQWQCPRHTADDQCFPTQTKHMTHLSAIRWNSIWDVCTQKSIIHRKISSIIKSTPADGQFAESTSHRAYRDMGINKSDDDVWKVERNLSSLSDIIQEQ